jgi:hypothetical protein
LEDLIRHAVQANLELQADEDNITATRTASKRSQHASTKTDHIDKKFTGNCNKCEKIGHKAKDCYSKVDIRSNQRFHPYQNNGSNSSSGSTNSSSGVNSSSRTYFSNQQSKPQYASASSNNSSFHSSSSTSTVSPATSYSSSSHHDEKKEGTKKLYHVRH